MFKTIIASAALALIAGSAFATHPSSIGTVSVTGSGTNTITSSTAAGSYVLGVGSSKSTASNTQTATAYVGGSGSGSSTPTNQFVSVADCLPDVKVHGTKLTGTVTVFGGTSATGSSQASNVSTGSGVGVAQALGSSFAEVAGQATLKSPNINLSASGTSFSGVVTNTGVVGTNGSGSSTGAVSSAFKATESGSLFTYKYNGVAGDVKSLTSNSYTRVGGIPTVTTTCGGTNCVTGPSVATGGAVVEGGATAVTNGSITATIKP